MTAKLNLTRLKSMHRRHAGKSNLLSAVAFAMGMPVSSSGATVLRELINHDAQPGDPCEAEVTIQQVKPAVPGTKPQTVIHASLRDGTREFRIDGKRRTMQQVHALLHACNLHVGMVKQASVTVLADCKDSMVVAAVVADASGLSR